MTWSKSSRPVELLYNFWVYPCLSSLCEIMFSGWRCLFNLKPILCHTFECVCVLSYFSPVWLFAAPWTIVFQSPLSLGFSRQEHLSGLPCLPPGNLPDPGIKPELLQCRWIPCCWAMGINSQNWVSWEKA